MPAVRYPCYPAYKLSGVEWLGEIPAHWEVARLGQVFVERREKVSDKDFPPLSVTKSGVVPQLENAAKTDAGDNRKKVCKGDFVINSRSDRKGSSGLSKLEGSVSLISIVLQPKSIDGSFTHHLLRSYPFQEEFYRFGKGIVADLWSTNYSQMKLIKIPLPIDSEQKQIAAFLDQQTAVLDSLIREKQALIQLLQEKRAAVIGTAVTQGLDPTVPMKESGAIWFKKIPANWNISPLKYLTRQIIDGTHHTPTYVNEGIPFLRVTDIHDSEINFEEVRRIPQTEHTELIKRCKPEKGDLLLSKNGTIGVPKVVDWDREFSIFVSLCLIKIRPELDVHFAKYIFLSPQIESQINFGGKTNTITNLHLDKIQNFIFPLPPIDEQQRIVDYLDKETAKLDELIAETEASIATLQEYRTALIAAAVTGQIDVRSTAA